mmetsp:Transcript_52890/g.104983  ORF Transcript_52890/g.104983 Transcript_52890/m.104983 type:complete len:224 (+) Transcript_52890:38-709(+)
MELKTVIVGDTDVGKTSLSSRFAHGLMPPASTPTIGASFLQKRMHVHPSSSLSDAKGAEAVEMVFQLWDTAGQERFRSMSPMYYRGAKAAVIVFDVSKEGGFGCVADFRRDILQYADASVVIAIVANKADLPPHASFDLASCEDAAATMGASFHVASAVSGEGVEDLFVSLGRSALRAHTEQWAGVSQEERRGGGSGIGDRRGEEGKPVNLSGKGKIKSKPCC